ncbi:MAG: NACHT domain-containing protein [Desulfobacterales bacterium]|nr:NACHT domain-containing protein [Desulfobacterales bacterium]
MKDLYGSTKIWRMESPVDLEGIFTHVNVLCRLSAFRRDITEQLEKIYLDKAKFGDIIEHGLEGLRAVNENDKLFILGKPGAGKTTFLKHVTLQAISGRLESYVPIFVTLRDFSESGKLLYDFIVEQFDICDFPDAQPFIKTVLKLGKAIILCDGLDEVNKDGGVRDRVIKQLKDFSNKYSKAKYVVTCRVAATDYNFEGFTYVEMADFDDNQIESFVKKRFAGQEKLTESFLKEFRETRSGRLRDLAKNPLLLTLLCIGYRETLEFPSRRSEIYDDALNVLLKKWDTTRMIKRDEIYKDLSVGRKNQMFARIAAETFEATQYLVEQKQLEKKVVRYLKSLPSVESEEDIDGVAVIKAIEAQHGIFVERAQKIHSFSHLTFQEYYTARYVVAHYEKTLKPLIYNHCFDETWREVFLLVAELLDDADGFFEIFIRFLDDFALGDERLVTFLAMVEKEGKEYNLFEKRNIAGFFILDTSASIALVINIASAIASIRASDIARAIASTSAIVRARAGDIASDIARANANANASASTSDIPSDIAIASNIALDKSKKMGLTELHKALSKVSVPTEDSSKDEFRNFSKTMLNIFESHFNIEDYKFTREQAEHVRQYYYATELIIDCLKIAYVSDRERIEDRLLRPPVR